MRKATEKEVTDFLHKTVTDKQIKLVSRLVVDNGVELLVIKDRGFSDTEDKRVTLEEFNEHARYDFEREYFEFGRFIVEV